MQMDMNLVNLRSTDCDRHDSDPEGLDEDVEQSVDLISRGFSRKVNLEFSDGEDDDDDLKLLPDSERRSSVDYKQYEVEGRSSVDFAEKEKGEGEEDEDSDSDFTFMFIGDHDSSNFDDKLFDDGQIKPVFPLFDQNLLLDGEYDIEEIDRLPIAPPVDKIFIESPRGVPSVTTSEYVESDGVATGPYCDWSKESATANAELSKKSNSTGFSKLWRLREKVGRSNSDGRDAFVFLKSSDRMTSATATETTSSSSSSSSSHPSNRTFVKVNVTGGKARVVNVKQGTIAKKPAVSAHEAYLKSRGGHTEEERRRSYLPYRPELMGFFTNVHSGLSRNVHPY